MKNAAVMGAYLLKQLNALKKKHSVIREVRGMALMTGIELAVEGKEIYEECLKRDCSSTAHRQWSCASCRRLR